MRLIVDDLRVAGETELVHGVSFTVGSGEAVALVGESGSGKSLTLRAVMGLLPPGLRISGGRIEPNGRLGMIFQDPLSFLDPVTRIGDLIAQVARANSGGSQAAARGRAAELLTTVRLPLELARRYPHQLSGGQRQRALLAVALATEPQVLLCDEPTTALDVTVQREILELLAQLRDGGLSLLFVSHDLAVASQLCEQVVVLSAGEVAERGRFAEVIQHPASPVTKKLLDAVLPLPEVPDE